MLVYKCRCSEKTHSVCSEDTPRDSVPASACSDKLGAICPKAAKKTTQKLRINGAKQQTWGSARSMYRSVTPLLGSPSFCRSKLISLHRFHCPRIKSSLGSLRWSKLKASRGSSRRASTRVPSTRSERIKVRDSLSSKISWNTCAGWSALCWHSNKEGAWREMAVCFNERAWLKNCKRPLWTLSALVFSSAACHEATCLSCDPGWTCKFVYELNIVEAPSPVGTRRYLCDVTMHTIWSFAFFAFHSYT